MTAPKKPQDHQKKNSPIAVEVGGTEYVIQPDALDDFELLDDIHTMDSGGGAAALVMPRVLQAILGADQYRLAMDSLRSEETGRVTIEAGAEFVEKLLKGISPNS